MQKYALWLKQTGEGCDYTVGCGNTLEPLRSETFAAAVVEAKEIIEERTHRECHFKTATLVQVIDDMSAHCTVAVKKMHDREAEEKQAAKRAQLEQLKRELGEK